ncbi:MAG: molybdopterin-binding protein [Leptospirillia bacterium]
MPRKGIDPKQLARVLDTCLPPPAPRTERITLSDARSDINARLCAGRILAPHPLPPHPISRVDGFAVTGTKPGEPQPETDLTVTRRVHPGDPVPEPVQAGTAVALMTGAPLPPGCSGVIPVEHCTEADGRVRIIKPHEVPPIEAGSRAAEGTVLIDTGEPVLPARMARLAEFGITELDVFALPVVDLIATGSELGDPNAPHHFDSNSMHLAALTRQAGGQARTHAPAADDPEVIANALGKLDGDVTVITGGTSAGRRDYTSDAISWAGFDGVIEGLNLRPGQTVRVALKGARILVSLPGSPGAIAPLFALLVGPLLARAGGAAAPGPAWHSARLSETVSETRPVDLLTDVRLTLRNGIIEATPCRDNPEGFLLIPKGKKPVAAGTVLPLLMVRMPLPAA